MTLAERVAELSAVNGVVAAIIDGEPKQLSLSPSIHLARVTYWRIVGSLVTDSAVAVVVLNYGVPETEAAYWLRKVPDILQPAAAATTYFTSRNSPFTAAQIETYCNQIWVAANASAGPILEFNVQAVNGKTVKVSGKFDVGGASREDRSYYIWLVDPNGSVAAGNANVKFERIS